MALSISPKDFFEAIDPFDSYEETTIYIGDQLFVESFCEDTDKVIRTPYGEDASKDDVMESIKNYKVVSFYAEQITSYFDGEGVGVRLNIYLR